MKKIIIFFVIILIFMLSGCVMDNFPEQKKTCPFECCYNDSTYLDKNCPDRLSCGEFLKCVNETNTNNQTTKENDLNTATKSTEQIDKNNPNTKSNSILACPYQCCEDYKGFENKNCDNKHYCDNGNCFLKDGCKYNNPSCGSQYNCENNVCILESEKCEFDQDCKDWEYCETNNACQLTSGACNTDSDCLSGLVCSNNYCEEETHQEINYGNALQDVFSITELKEYPFNCATPDYIKKWYYTDLNINTEEISFEARGVDVTIFVPEPNTEKLDLANQGKIILESYLPKIQDYFGPYPCDNLIVQAYSDAALGSPGSIIIGGDGGLNHPWLLGHELIHSYFFTGVYPEWFTEGPSSTVPFILLDDSRNTLESAGIGNTDLIILDDYKSGINTKLLDMDFNRPVCELSGMKSSYAGRYLILEYLYFNIGKENLLNIIRLAWEKYKYTNKKVNNADFCKAALYFTPEEQKEKVKEYLNYMLCGACD